MPKIFFITLDCFDGTVNFISSLLDKSKISCLRAILSSIVISIPDLLKNLAGVVISYSIAYSLYTEPTAIYLALSLAILTSLSVHFNSIRPTPSI